MYFLCVIWVSRSIFPFLSLVTGNELTLDTAYDWGFFGYKFIIITPVKSPKEFQNLQGIINIKIKSDFTCVNAPHRKNLHTQGPHSPSLHPSLKPT